MGFCAVLACASLQTPVMAKVTLPAFFTSNMIIQQKTTMTLFGKAKANKKVSVETSWNNQHYEAQADAKGNWRIEIATPAAGGPYRITLSDGKKTVLDNVMAGEVWFCSGQSNMEMPLAGWGKIKNYEQEIAAADYPGIRLFQVKKHTSVAPLDAYQVESTMGGWKECSPSTVPEFSAVAYLYARELHRKTERTGRGHRLHLGRDTCRSMDLVRIAQTSHGLSKESRTTGSIGLRPRQDHGRIRKRTGTMESRTQAKWTKASKMERSAGLAVTWMTTTGNKWNSRDIGKAKDSPISTEWCGSASKSTFHPNGQVKTCN